MPKIILIHPQAGIDWKSNSSVFAVELARHLDNYLEVELLSGAECGSFSRPISSLASNNISLENSLTTTINRWFNRPKSIFHDLTSFLPCITYLLNNPADLLLPLNGYSSLLAATCIRSIDRTPILFTQHNHLNLERNLNLKPDRLITFNPVTAKHARAIAPNQTIDTIPIGIDPTEFSLKGNAMITGLPKPCVLLIADLNRYSNQRIELTIEAVARLPEASLLICGEGADRDYFQALGDRLLGTGRFQIRTFPYAQMPQVYRSANVLTSAATQPPYGLKYVEAMACGLPVVTTDDEIRRYLIGDGGITCDVTNLDLYAESLKLALEKHWYQQHPRQNALRFSWQGITLLYYQAVLKTITTTNYRFISPNPNHSIEG